MGQPIDLSGQAFGRLRVAGRSERRNATGSIFWKCHCECGSVCDVSSIQLRSGKTQSCGCIRAERYEELKAKAADLSGMVFGRLVALSRDGYIGESRKVAWLCHCECGKTTRVAAQSLTQGATKSCGCLNLNTTKRRQDIAGKRFGALLVLSVAGVVRKRSSVELLWLCRCDCGKEKAILARSLIHQKTRSCGCAQFSAGGLSGTREYRCASEAKRRAASKRGARNYTALDIRRIYKAQRGLCAYCHAAMPLLQMHRDHIFPLALGGDNSPSNIQMLCPACNLSKHAKHPIDFAQSRGLLL